MSDVKNVAVKSYRIADSVLGWVLGLGLMATWIVTGLLLWTGAAVYAGVVVESILWVPCVAVALFTFYTSDKDMYRKNSLWLAFKGLVLMLVVIYAVFFPAHLAYQMHLVKEATGT